VRTTHSDRASPGPPLKNFTHTSANECKCSCYLPIRPHPLLTTLDCFPKHALVQKYSLYEHSI
jgi:hypothetical protein